MSEIRVVRPRVLNARFVVALIALVAVMVGSYALVMTLQHQATSDRNTAALIVRNKALFTQNATLIAEIKADDAEAASERAKLLDNQRALLAYTRQLDARESALLAYLHAHGIRLPTRLISVIQPPVLKVVTSAPKASKHRKHGKR